MNNYDLVFFDLETFGLNTMTCPVIDASFLRVNTERMGSDNPYNIPELVDMSKKYKLNVADQVEKYNFKIEPDTVAWWEEQDPSVRKLINPKPDDLTLDAFVDRVVLEFRGKNIDFYFTRGNTFDPIILQRLFRAVDREDVFKTIFYYNRVRDIRTWIDAKLDYPGNNGFDVDIEYWDKMNSHNSVFDVVKDVLRYQKIHRTERGLV